ncbi:unnamed protein product [Urochloa decumbens]|uniref:Ubiquitin-like protease family profile domain-containing protein n=1 Tax=Urochloa decumbens TaxID=240449 RepID=A0ABC9F8X6_9POAL
MAGGDEKRRAAAIRDGLGLAASVDSSANQGRVALSPLDLFSLEQRNRPVPPELPSKRNMGTAAFGSENIRPSNNDLLSTANINLMEEFVAFCKTKKANKVHEPRKHPRENLQDKHFDEVNEFKDKLVLLYGDYLPKEVIDGLCQLTHDNSLSKCKSCFTSVENLVIRVLQILSDAASKKYENLNVSNNVDNSIRYTPPQGSCARDKVDCEFANESTHNPAIVSCTIQEGAQNQRSHAPTAVEPSPKGPDHCIDPIVVPVKTKPSSLSQCHQHSHNVVQASMELHDGNEHSVNLKSQLFKKNMPIVIDAPVCIAQKPPNLNENFSYAEPIQHINKRLRPTRPVSLGFPAATKLFQDEAINIDQEIIPSQTKLKEKIDDACLRGVGARPSSNAKDVGLHSSKPSVNDRCSELGKFTDQLYNQKNLPKHESRQGTHQKDHPNILNNCLERPNSSFRAPKHRARNTPQLHDTPSRFPVTDTERDHYFVLCGLAHSQWNCLPAIKFLKTSVTYCSLGNSVEPNGHVDNFFIAGICRKFFEDLHPRRSKKHFFYPKVGGSLLSYNSQYDINVVKNSFYGANSAYKLHLSNKLCFPICKDEHWFVFIVDLKNKLFVFLDSFYDENHSFQINARSNLVNSFKECWYEHADVKLDLEDFSEVYPPVPKQANTHDCGIFAIMYMEAWDNNIDLRQVFSQHDIPNIRIKLAVSLFFSTTNTVDKTLVQNFFEQGLDPRLCK